MNRNSRKQEVASKVKEIKQRQQNWLKQRAEYQQTEKVEDSFTADSTLQPSPLYTTSNIDKPFKKDSSSPSNKIGSLLASKKSNAKFENWLKAKQNTDEDISHQPPVISSSNGYHESKRYNSENYTDGNYGNNLYINKPYRDHQGSKEVNVLRVPSSRSPESATPDPGWNSEDETGEITAAQLLSPEDFDAVADNIINRVKGDLGMRKRNDQSVLPVKSAKGRSTRDEHFGKTRESKTGDGYPMKKAPKANIGMANHVCPSCDKLMVPPHCSPMLLIPCGHTLCKQCSKRTKYCGMCGSRVESNTGNTMLEQIITSYNSNQTSYSPLEHTSQNSKDLLQYREEYQNLQTREDILQEECDNIDRTILQLSQQLSVQNQQIDNIQAQEDKVSAEILALQEKLQTLQTHRQEYEQSCDSLQADYKQEKNRLLMIKESIDSIKKQKEKIKLLAENEC